MLRWGGHLREELLCKPFLHAFSQFEPDLASSPSKQQAFELVKVQAAVLEVRAEAAKADTALEAEVDVLRASQQEAAVAHAFAEQARQGSPPSIWAPQLICCRWAQQEIIQSGVTTDNCDSGLQMSKLTLGDAL